MLFRCDLREKIEETLKNQSASIIVSSAVSLQCKSKMKGNCWIIIGENVQAFYESDFLWTTATGSF